jgi:uncharacterized membrane protein
MDKMIAITIHDATPEEKGSEEEEGTANMSSEDSDKNQHVVGDTMGFGYSSNMTKSFSPKRMIFYADSIMAITKLFLIVPLLKAVHTAEETGMSLFEFLQKHISLFPSFALSFSMISMFWGTHEELFRHVESVTANVVEVFNNLFLFVITTMPVTSASNRSIFPPFLYVVNLMLINIFLTAMHIVVRKDVQVRDPSHIPCTSFGLLHLSLSFVLLSLIIVIVCIFPSHHLLYLLFTLLLVKPLMRCYHGIDDLTHRFGQLIDQVIGCRSKDS